VNNFEFDIEKKGDLQVMTSI